MKTKMRFIKKIFSVLFIASLLMACEKDVVDGSIGPRGPQGEQGEAGPQGTNGVDGEALGIPGPQGANGADGANGANGADGADGVDGADGADGVDSVDGTDGADGADGQDGATGTANVIYSGWIDTEFPNNIGSSGAGFDIDAPDLTMAILDRGTIMVFGRNLTISGFDYFAMPFINSGDQHNFRVETEGVLRITVASLDGSTSVGSPFFEDYRYIIIPGENPASTGTVIGAKSQSLDFAKMSYAEITKHLNISE